MGQPAMPKKLSGPVEWKEGTIVVPGVKELCQHFHIDDQVASLLDAQLKKRPKTFEGDVETVWEALTLAKSPGAQLMKIIKDLQQGTFAGHAPNYKQIQAMGQMFKLDELAMEKLTDVLVKMGADRAKKTIPELARHLECSNKP